MQVGLAIERASRIVSQKRGDRKSEMERVS
jgi:hypothetical protein